MQRMPGWLQRGGLVVALGWFMSIQPATAQYQILHHFAGWWRHDGGKPSGSLTLSRTILYGMTSHGGDNDAGTIFKINTDGTGYTILHNFTLLGSDGRYPNGDLILSGSTLYGITSQSGIGPGIIFKINTDGTGYTILHHFNAYTEGSPSDSLTLVGSTLYGTTSARVGDDAGTIFKINTDGSGFTIIYVFARDYSDGRGPQSLTLSGSTLYGMTFQGGDLPGRYYWGTVFKINTDGTGFATLHRFAGSTGGDGACPVGSPVISGSTLYGMTINGGINNWGTVFKVNTDGTGYAILHAFDNAHRDGMTPEGSLILSNSTLYGMTHLGGRHAWGTAFKINTDGSGFAPIHSFGSPGDGGCPTASLTLSGSTLYGMTSTSGTNHDGVVFAMSTRIEPMPTIKANGATGNIDVNYPNVVSIKVAMNAGDYAGLPMDWWVIARAGSSWYFMNSAGQWTRNLSNCLPAYQGGLFNLPDTQVLNMSLPVGLYTFWFAVDYPMDGILNGQILFDKVDVAVR